MSNILILVDRYFPNASSNGICAFNVCSELIGLGYNAIILDIDNCIENRTHFSLAYGRRSITNFNKLFSFTQDSKLIDLLYKKAKELHNKYKFCAVISFFRPVETILCGERLHRLDHIKHIPCFLDIPETSYSSNFKKKILNVNYCRLYHLLLKTGKIIALKYYNNYFHERVSDRDYSNILFTGIPNLSNTDLRKSRAEIDNYLNIVYTGSFSRTFRNPDKMLSYLFEVIKGERIRLHLFSWGCEEIISKYCDIYQDQMIIHGRVSNEVAHQAISSANVLINLANKDTIQVPGKMIEYLSSGKPIIYFQSDESDIYIEEFSKYPAIFFSRLFEDCYGEKFRCLEFIKANKKYLIDFDSILVQFGEHSSRYFARVINAILDM